MSLSRVRISRYLPVALIVAVGLSVSIVVFTLMRAAEHDKVMAVLDEAADERAARFEGELLHQLDTGKSIVNLIGAVGEPSRATFHDFTAPIIEQNPQIQALEWVPRIKAEDLEIHERAARADGLEGYAVRGLDEDGNLSRVGQRDEYFPVYYAEPADPNSGAFGLDLASISNRRASLEQARDQGVPVATRRLALQQGGSGVLVLIPIYEAGSTPRSLAERREKLIGFSVLVFNTDTVFESVINSFSMDGVELAISDVEVDSSSESGRVTITRRNAEEGEAGFERGAPRVEKTFELAGREWSIAAVAGPKFIERHTTQSPWFGLFSGLVMTLMLAAVVYREAKHGVKELQRTNDALEKAIEVSSVTQVRLETEQDLLSAIVETAVDGVVTIDEAGTIRTANSVLLETFGYTIDEIFGQNVKMLMPDPYQSEHDNYLENYYSTGEQKIIGTRRELLGRHKDGREFPIEIGVSETVTPDGKVFTGILRDISRRIRQQEEINSLNQNLENLVRARTSALSLSELRLNEAQQMARVGNWELNLVTSELTWSDEIFRIFEIDKEKFGASYEAFLNAIHPDDVDAVNAAYTRSLETQEPYGITHRLLMPDGRVKFVHEQCKSIFDEDGKALNSIGTVQDITERVVVEKALQEREAILADFKYTLDQTQDCVFMFDPETLKFNYFNQGAINQVGYTQEEMFEMTPLDIKPEFDEQSFRKMIQPLIADTTASHLFETVHRHKDGHDTLVEVALQLVKQEQGGKRFVALVRDITERKRAEQEIYKLNAELEQRVIERTEQLQIATKAAEDANRAKSEFLSRMSHELRTPLNAILGYAQLLDMSYEDPTIKEHSVQIINGGKHLLELINEVLDIASIEAGKLQLSIEPVSVLTSLRSAVSLISPIAKQSSVEIHFADSCNDLFVRADEQRLIQVFINLLSNGIKYNRSGGRLAVSCSVKDDDNYLIQFDNTGAGISADDLERLFKPFERLKEQQEEGTGLGLALSQQLIQRMGGSLELVSSHEDHTIFGVTLKKASQPEILENETGLVPENKQRLTIAAKVLCIEDNLSNMRLIEHVFAGWKNATLIPAMRGSTGLELAREHHPDLILLDVHLPDMDGYEVLRTLRADPATSDIAVVVVSADATDSQVKRMMSLGAHTYLTKPIDMAQFNETLNEILKQIAAKITD